MIKYVEKPLNPVYWKIFSVVCIKSKRSIEDHFDSNFELEYNLKEKGEKKMIF